MLLGHKITECIKLTLMQIRKVLACQLGNNIQILDTNVCKTHFIFTIKLSSFLIQIIYDNDILLTTSENLVLLQLYHPQLLFNYDIL